MSHFEYPFLLPEDDKNQINGRVELEDPVFYRHASGGNCYYRPGRIIAEGGVPLDIILYHNKATAKFMYLRNDQVDPNLLEYAGMGQKEIASLFYITLPGQLCMGQDRTKLIGQAVEYMFNAPPLKADISGHKQQDMAVFPIAREGLKYQVTEALFGNYGFYCDEILLDAHHVFSSDVPVYNRAVEFTLFKDKDLDQHQKERITVAFIADSIASGLVMKEVIARIKQRFDHMKQVEVIAPLATIRGLCRIAQAEAAQDVKVRVHVFETLLNALPPDYYYSAHFNTPEMHIRPDLEEKYRSWWGKDSQGNDIADTACAGYGWSEGFYSPRKQIQMMNGELETRHNLKIVDILRRNI